MRQVILCFFIIAFTTGCGTKAIQPIAYDCPKIKLPNDPIDYTKSLNEKSTPDEVIKAWVATAQSYKGWNKTVRRQITV